MFGGLYSVGEQSGSAHESRLYTIGDQDYWITVGSIDEPVFVDDKSGVEAFISLADPADPLNADSNGTKPVEGLEETLKFEVSAGDKNKVFQVDPAYNDPGHYEAVFYPTVETTYNYSVVGTINNVTVSLDYQCRTGEGEGSQDNSTKQISEGVTQKAQSGGFGCVSSRADLAFPEPYVSNNELINMINQTKTNTTIT
jgi:hypothetical protein